MLASILHDAIWVNLTTTCWSLLQWFVLLGPWRLASRVLRLCWIILYSAAWRGCPTFEISICEAVPKVTEALRAPFWHPVVYVFGGTHAVLREHRDACPGAVPVLVCHDEVVIERVAERATEAKAWLEAAIFEGMNAVMNGAGEARVPVEVEARIDRSWAEGD
jgi:hypothetical protein